MFSLLKFFSKDDKFFKLLESSAEEVAASVKALAKFTQHPEQTRTLNEFIASRRKEKAIAVQISDDLCTTFVTALDREDIEELSSALYRVPKTVMKIGERILLAPHLMRDVDLSKQVSMLEQAAEVLLCMIRELHNGVRPEQIRSHNIQLQAIEKDADRLVLDLLKQLYSSQVEPYQLVFLKDLFELLERITDHFRDAGNVIVHIVLKNS
jgi:uncharacterized protein